MIESVARDLLHAARMLRRTRGFTATAVAVLAVGIGANTAVFSVVNAVLLQPLPYPEPDRIVQVMIGSPQTGRTTLVSVPKFSTLRDQVRVFQALAAYQASDPGVNVTGGDRPEHLRSLHVSAEYFAVFGATVRAGRTFAATDDVPHGPRVAVITNGLWVRRFGSDPGALGSTIQLGGDGHEIVGILAPGFVSDPAADIFLPLQLDLLSFDHSNYLHVAGRLRRGVTLASAREALSLATDPFRRKFPFALGPWEGFTAERLRDVVVGDVRASLRLLTGAVVFVLLIACANVANLLLARGHRRRREIATRIALGSPRSRVVRQLLTESLLLSIAGGLAGLALGYASVRVLLAAAPGNIPRIGVDGSGIDVDVTLLLFTMAVSVSTGVLFGVVPALTAARTELSAAFKDSGVAADGGRRNRAQAALVVAEMMLALVLLVGSGLMIRTFQALSTVDRGFNPRSVLTLEMSLSGTPLRDTAALMQFVRNAEERLGRISGVAHAAAARSLPLDPAFRLPFVIERRMLPGDGGAFHGMATWRSVTPHYFDALRIQVRRGRVFSDLDSAGAVPVAVINRAMARTYWQQLDPLGERLIVGAGAARDLQDGVRQIVGVVDDVRDEGAKGDPGPTIYVPMAQVPDALTARNNRLYTLSWIVRTHTPPEQAAAAVAHELQSTSGGLPVARIRTMDQIVAGSTARAAFSMTLLTTFAIVSLSLAVIGMYGLMSYSVQQRTQEIGIRMALGAVQADVRNMILAQGLRLAGFGVGLGIAAALLLTRLMATVVFGVRTYEPSVFGAVAVLLAAVALVAAYVPARRATQINPLDALRF
jgi:predicted permease